MTKKDFIIFALSRLKEWNARQSKLYEMGIDVMELAPSLVDTLETSLSMLIDGGSDASTENIVWWLYDTSPKVIHEADGSKVDITDVSDFAEWLLETYETKTDNNQHE